MKTITVNELVKELASIGGATFASIDYIGQNDAFKKTGLMEAHGFLPSQVKKHSKLTVFFGACANYENLVNKRLATENAGTQLRVTFESQGLPENQEWVGGAEGIIIRSKKDGTLYLRTYPDCTKNTPVVHYQLDGKGIDPKDEKFSPFWTKSFREKQKGTFTEGKNQGLERTVKPRNYILSNIKYITMGGETYRVIG
jgi:hypothetical protein